MKRLTMAIAAVALVATACTGANDSTPDTEPDSSRVQLAANALRRFDQCDALLEHLKSEARERVTAYGLDGEVGFWGGPVAIDVLEEAADTASAAPADGGIAGVDFSTTNVQEAGIDEPDLVKTDGSRIIALSNGALHYVDVTDAGPVIRSSLAITSGWVSEMLLAGDTVVLFGQGHPTPVDGPARSSIPPGGYGGSTAMIVQIDISNPDDLLIESTLYLDGAYLSARMSGTTARVVIDSFPTALPFTYPQGSGLLAERRAIAANRDVIDQSTIENWIPFFVLERADGTGDEGLVLECGDAHVPNEFSGFGALVVLTLDLDAGLSPESSVGVYANGQTVYASHDNLFVATNRWIDWATIDSSRDAPTMTTQIHQFDTTQPTTTDYVASGDVDGYLLNQFAMSEHEGVLRVASTSAPAWWGGERRSQSESLITTLRNDGEGTLRELGRVDGLGRGEQIFSVRFMGPIVYVVTFERTDPLYTVDLSDPAAPRTLGELKINGYSAYIHPLDEAHLLGIGQDATDEGRVLGTQISIFDVSDLENPSRTHQLVLGEGNSEVEFDHRAFLLWAPSGTAVLPVSFWSWDEETDVENYWAGAVALSVDAESGIAEQGRISHADDDNPDSKWMGQIRRSLVIDDTLYTVSDLGIHAHRLGDLQLVGSSAW